MKLVTAKEPYIYPVNAPIRAIIVDDEESARDVLENLLRRHCPQVTVLEKYAQLPAAVTGVKQHQPDLVFLDIEMPNYAGYQILDFFDEINFDIIFVTAFDSYAVKAFEIAAVDYLLKPVEIQRLKDAVNKVSQLIGARVMSEQFAILQESLNDDKVKNLVITEKGDQYIVPVAKIIAVEAQEAYSKIHTLEKSYVASKNLKHFQGLLAENTAIFRSHKSWIVNLDQIVKYNRSKGEILLQNGLRAKLSKYRKEEFEATFLRK